MKTYKYERVGMRELVLDDLDNCHDPSVDLLSCVTMIICANPQNHNLQEQKRQKCKAENLSLTVWSQFTCNLDFKTMVRTINLL